MIGTETSNKPPVGDFFLTFDTGGMFERQGQVIGEPQPGFYLCQMYGGGMGLPLNRILVPVAECVGWRFYPTAEQWREAGETELARLRDALRAEEAGRRTWL